MSNPAGMLKFDTFCYNGDEILPFRLDYLYDHVDYFVIVESRLLFSGKDKGKYYIDDVLPSLWKYFDKLIIVRVAPEDFAPVPENFHGIMSPNGTNREAWWREHSAREFAKPEIQRIANNKPFIVHCSDCDEIPHHWILDDPNIYRATAEPMYMHMKFFYYSFRWQKQQEWRMSYIVNDQTFAKRWISDMRLFGNKDYHAVAGWHCSYFMGRPNMVQKIEGGSHMEYNNDAFKTDEHIDECLKRGTDMFNREGSDRCVLSKLLNHELPPFWQRFQKMLDTIQERKLT